MSDASQRITFKGSTWGHERGYAPLISLSESHSDLFPANVNWEVRTLQQFADQSIGDLAEIYDFIVFDHPWIGEIASKKYFYPLDELLSKDFLADQERNSVGSSYKSYIWKNQIYGIPIDAAGHVSAYRPDLLRNGESIPDTWSNVLDLAKSQFQKGEPRIALSLDPVNIWCLFMTLAANLKLKPYTDGSHIVPRQFGIQILEQIIEIAKYGPKEAYNWNPIQVLDAMSSADEILYCPSLFGYSNYSIAGFRKNLVEFSSIPDGGFGKIGGILGGAGIGITKSCKNPEVAAKVIEIIASPKIQSTLYPFSGGQPGHRAAWLDSAVNKNTSNFYRNTLENLDNSYLRPTFPGFIELQTKSGDIFSEVIHGRSTPNDALDSVDQLYRDILRKWESFS